MAVRSLTLTKMRANARRRLNQTVNSKNLDNDDLNDYLNTAQEIIVEHTDCLRKMDTITIVSGTPDYTLPDDWRMSSIVQYITSGSELKKLDYLPFGEYMSYRTIATSSFPEKYTLDEADSKIIIYKTPTGTGATAKHYYLPQLDELINDSDVPFNANKRLYLYHKDVVDLAVNLLRARDEGVLQDNVIASFVPRLKAIKQALSTPKKATSGQMKSFNDGSGNVERVSLPSNYPRIY